MLKMVKRMICFWVNVLFMKVLIYLFFEFVKIGCFCKGKSYV